MTRVLTNYPEGGDFSEETDSPDGLLATPAGKQHDTRREFTICDSDRENEVNDLVNHRLNERSVNPLSHHGFANTLLNSVVGAATTTSLLRVPLPARQQCSSLIHIPNLRTLCDLRGAPASPLMQRACSAPEYTNSQLPTTKKTPPNDSHKSSGVIRIPASITAHLWQPSPTKSPSPVMTAG